MPRLNKSSRPAPFSQEPGLGPLAEGGGTHLFRQVKRRLLLLIEKRHYAPGDCLPSESELSATLGVSIGTLRKAVDELVHEHVLLRRQGKGTFVTQHNHDRFLFQFFHVEQRDRDMYQQPEYPEVKCLGFERTKATSEEATALGLREGDPVFRVVNLLALAGRPTVCDQICISALLFKGLSERRLVERPGTIYQFYQQEFGITVLRAQERARAVAASREMSRVLHLPAGQPVMQIHRTALTFGDKPVEYRVSTVNTQYCDYVSDLSRPKGQ